jgi:radical SAM protein with 4Fe4S-binding SPASM domain
MQKDASKKPRRIPRTNCNNDQGVIRKHLRLKEDRVLVKGTARSALYDLSDGKVYSLNRSAHKALASGRVRRRHRLFIEEVARMGLVETAADPFPPVQRLPEKTAQAALEFMWLEVTSRCNLTCLHCYGDCLSTPAPDRMDEKGWKAVLRRARALGCSQVQFIGGEPLLKKDLFTLVAYARKKHYSFVEIFSNLTLLKKEHLPFLKDNGVHIATTLYSAHPETHDRITGTQGSHAKTMAGIHLLKKRGIPVRVAIIAMKQNQTDLAATVEFLHQLGVQYKLPDPVRPTGRGCSQEIQPQDLPPEFSGQMMAANFWTDRHSFYFNKKYNSCWTGKMAVTATGAVIPCIFARDQVVDNCLTKGLKAIVRGKKLQGFWKLTKDHVAVCRACEYRYACHDCRPLAYGQGGDLYAKSPRCLYDPLRGTWGKG